MEDINLNNLVSTEGTVLNEKTTSIEKGDDAELTLNNMIKAASNPGIMPGEKITLATSEDVAMNKEEAANALIEKAALDKLKREKEAFQKLSDEAKLKDYLYKNEVSRFRMQHGYELSGSQKRNIKREIERSWDKGKFSKWVDEHGEDVLYELNKPSAQPHSQSAGDAMRNTTAQPITSLSSLIHPIQ